MHFWVRTRRQRDNAEQRLVLPSSVPALTVSHPVIEVTKVGDNGPASPVNTHVLFNLMFE